jgi:cell division GTPase FtsZ
VNRRRFLYFLSSLTAASLSVPSVSSMVPDPKSCTEKSGRDARSQSDGRLNVGIVGVGGPGVFYLDRVAQSFNYPCKQIAIAQHMPYLRFSCAERAVLIANLGAHPSTVIEDQLILRDRMSDIANLVSGLDIAFILTNLYAPSDQGISAVVAEALREADVFTVAIKPTGREIEGYRSLKSLVDVGFEMPMDVIKHEIYLPRRRSRGELFCAAIAQICRIVTLSLAKSGSPGIDATELRSVLGGDDSSVMTYRNGDGVEGLLAAFDAACTSPHLGPNGVRASRGLVVSIEARPGILNDEDTDAIRDRMGRIAMKGAGLHLNTFENESLRSDYRVTFLARG